MDHLLTCSCGKEHSISKSQAGQEIQCECGAALRIPTLRGFSALPLAGAAQHNLPGKSVWKGWRGPALAFCAAAFLIGLASSGFFFYRSQGTQVDYSIDDFIADGNRFIDEYGPDELSTMWNDFETIGLRTRTPPDFHYYNVFSEEQKAKGINVAIVSGVFGLLAIGILLSARAKN